MKKMLRLGVSLAALAMLFSCGSKTYQKINYIQDVSADTTMAMKITEGILVQPKDMISVVVSSRSPELAAMFNLTNVSYQAGAETQSAYTRLLGYSVNSDGFIDFPQIGLVKVSGLTRWQVAEKIKNLLRSSNLLNDAVVSVEFMNFKISVVGEVARPGTFNISGDKITVLEAISLAGDLTIYGKRDNVSVIREQNGKRVIYQLDLRSTDLFNSDAYYLAQNDVVYVEPNSVRAGQSTINENSFKSVSFWVAIGSFLVTTANLVVTIINRAK